MTHNRDKAVCPAGHPLSGSNVYVRPRNGWRTCKRCRANSERRRYRARVRARMAAVLTSWRQALASRPSGLVQPFTGEFPTPTPTREPQGVTARNTTVEPIPADGNEIGHREGVHRNEGGHRG